MTCAGKQGALLAPPGRCHQEDDLPASALGELLHVIGHELRHLRQIERPSIAQRHLWVSGL